MVRPHLHFAKFWVGIFVICTLFIPTLAYGSATKISYGVDAKWVNNLNFMICISSMDKEHAELFIKAVDEWKARWDHFGYTLSYTSDCHINVYIVKTHPMLEEHGYLGYTELQYWNRGAIVKADIYLLTTKKITISSVVKGKQVTSELFQPLSNDEFYMAALHEFGHALNLGHFDDNGQEPIDIMYAHPAGDGKKQGISQTDIRALNWFYLRFLDQTLTIRTDKTSYKPGDTVRILGKVNPMIPGNIVRLDVLDQEKKLYRSEIVNISRDGTFSDKVNLPSKGEAGSFAIKVSYDGAVANASIDIIGPKASEVSESSLASVVGEIGVHPKTGDKGPILKTLIVDQSGFSLTSIPSHKEAFIQSSLSGTFADQKEATCIIQVKNKGYTVEIYSGTYNLSDGSVFSQTWLPAEAGRYDIQVFLWKSVLSAEPLMPNPLELHVIVT